MWEKIVPFLFVEHRGKTIGVLLGLIASILFVTFGFWRTIFIIICITVGYFIGKQLDDNNSMDSWMKQLFKDR